MVCREQPAWRACAETSPCWPHRAAAALPIQVSRGSLSKGAAPGAWFHLAVAYAAVVSLPLLLSTPGPPESLSVRRCPLAERVDKLSFRVARPWGDKVGDQVRGHLARYWSGRR